MIFESSLRFVVLFGYSDILNLFNIDFSLDMRKFEHLSLTCRRIQMKFFAIIEKQQVNRVDRGPRATNCRTHRRLPTFRTPVCYNKKKLQRAVARTNKFISSKFICGFAHAFSQGSSVSLTSLTLNMVKMDK